MEITYRLEHKLLIDVTFTDEQLAMLKDHCHNHYDHSVKMLAHHEYGTLWKIQKKRDFFKDHDEFKEVYLCWTFEEREFQLLLKALEFSRNPLAAPLYHALWKILMDMHYQWERVNTLLHPKTSKE